MAELARGRVADRPWGRTFATLGLRGLTGQLTLVTEGKSFKVAFGQGAVVAAASPLASDAAVRVALTSNLVSSSQVPEIARRQAGAPERDEVDVIAEQTRLGPDHTRRLRRRVIAQRAARTFSINHGEFVVADQTELAVPADCALDVRAVVYLGARANLSEPRLAAELDELGAWFQLKRGLDDDLPQFGFTDLEQPVIERLRDGGTLAEIEEFAASFIDGRTVRAVIYALASCGGCDLEPAPGQPRSRSPSGRASPPAPALADQTEPMLRTAVDPMSRTTTEPMPRAAVDPMSRTTTEPMLRTTEPASAAGSRLRSPSTPSQNTGLVKPSIVPPPAPDRLIPSKTMTRLSTSPPPLRPTAPLAAGSATLRPPAETFDGPTWGDADGDVSPSGEAVRREGSSGTIRLPSDDATRRDGSSGTIRPPSGEAMRRGGSSGTIRPPSDEAMRRNGSSGSIRLPSDDALRDGASTRRSTDEGRRAQSSSPGARRPLDRAEAGPGLVVRPVSGSRPAPIRQMVHAESPQSHDVKALIAQRLKLLDQGADHFQLLGVAHDVPTEALRKAYFALARQLHPDRLTALGIADEGKHAQRLFAQINTGFAILSDHGRRTRYLDVLRRGGEAAVRAEQARAEELARRILEAEEAYRRGELALRRDQPQAAVVELERAVELSPDEVDHHALLAWARFCAAPDRPAIAGATRTALDQAIQRAPRSVTARFYLGRVERMLGRDQDALRHFRDVLAAAPGHGEAAAEVRALEGRLPGGDKPGASGRTRR